MRGKAIQMTISRWRFDKSTVCTSIGKMKTHVDYKSAKEGDLIAADRLVADTVSREKLVLITQDHPEAIIVSIHEEGRTNAIPHALAHYIAAFRNMEVDSDIVKMNKTYHTGNNACHRMLNRSEFDGTIKEGREYMIVDDHITQGGTIADLRYYIESRGGKVIGATTLTASQGSTLLAPQVKTLDKLFKKIEPEKLKALLSEYKINGGDINALTNSEVGWFGQFRNIDSLRNRLLEEKQEGTISSSIRSGKRKHQESQEH